MTKRIVLAVCLIGLIGVVSGYAQPAKLKAMIDFPFTAAGKVLPAGQYEFSRDTMAPVFRVQGEDKSFVMAPVLTRLSAAIHTTPGDAHLVFDKVGETYFLSEVWIPGEDGYLLHAEKGKHEHKVVNIKY